MDLDIGQVPGAGKKPVTWQLWAGNSTLLAKSERLAEIGLLFRYAEPVKIMGFSFTAFDYIASSYNLLTLAETEAEKGKGGSSWSCCAPLRV